MEATNVHGPRPENCSKKQHSPVLTVSLHEQRELLPVISCDEQEDEAMAVPAPGTHSLGYRFQSRLPMND